MVRIRLRRVGARHQPSYRIVAADKESPRDGRFLENLGFYNPRTEPATVEIKEDRLFHWLKNGAQPSDAVVKVLKPLGTWDRWERFKGGEDLSTLIEDAESSKASVDPRTRRDDLAETRKSKKKAKAKDKDEETPAEVVEPVPDVEEIEAAPEEEDAEAPEEAEEIEDAPDEEPEATAEEVAESPAEEESSEGDPEGEASEEPAAEDEGAVEADVEEEAPAEESSDADESTVAEDEAPVEEQPALEEEAEEDATTDEEEE